MAQLPPKNLNIQKTVEINFLPSDNYTYVTVFPAPWMEKWNFQISIQSSNHFFRHDIIIPLFTFTTCFNNLKVSILWRHIYFISYPTDPLMFFCNTIDPFRTFYNLDVFRRLAEKMMQIFFWMYIGRQIKLFDENKSSCTKNLIGLDGSPVMSFQAKTVRPLCTNVFE